MKLFQSSQDRDLELLSAYIDGELSAREQAQLESRLAGDASLRRTLASLKRVQTTLHALPSVKPPRSFVLKPEMVGQPARQPGLSRLVPALNWATTLAAIVFAVVVGSQLATTSQPLAAPVANQAQSLQAPAIASDATGLNATEAASLKSVTAPAVTEFPPTIRQAPSSCGSSTQEPLTGGGCSGGEGGGNDTQVSPFAFSATNGTATVTPPGAADTSIAGGGAEPSATTAEAVEAPVANGTVDQVPTEATPMPDALSTLDTYATTEQPQPVPANEATATIAPLTWLEYGLGGLLVLLIVASILIRRR
jgi:hypothetical protein